MITEPVVSGSEVVLETTPALRRIVKTLRSLMSPECSVDLFASIKFSMSEKASLINSVRKP